MFKIRIVVAIIGLVILLSSLAMPKNYYDTKEWKTQRVRILKRDNYTCQLCGSHKYLNVHHVKYRMYSELDKDCIVLCKYCHAKQHPKNGRKILKQKGR